ncbi:hypothetical protein [Hufsiella ginkgonis]|uniref:UDP-glucose 6-dehydrogenase n=1 Tax=Hufsiella ginkgonis TaxID=2695274 RepID=A0A7K1Y301_9SPHI|nr:hypothetical protein [Hufsiella ginkgonis]MXV17478.1 hypothetical protein [Hufsiella ginkgonis]
MNDAVLLNGDKPAIGIIGTGWVGASYAKDFSSRGLQPVCYSLEPQFSANKSLIGDCDIVFIAVPTPTEQHGASYTILREVLQLVGTGKIAVIKSTVLPGTTRMLQQENPQIIVLHSPEFLSVATADHDAAYPKRNIIGIPFDDEGYQQAATRVLEVLPSAPYTSVCLAANAELIKYAHNAGGYLRIVFNNMLYDISQQTGGNWEEVRTAMAAAYPDSELQYLNPVHKNGRGAGGPCFIKDFSAFTTFYKAFGDEVGLGMLSAIQAKNISLLEASGKDLDILYTVHPDIIPMEK